MKGGDVTRTGQAKLKLSQVMAAGTIAGLSWAVVPTTLHGMRRVDDPSEICIDNVRNLGIAMQLYASDYNDAIVPFTTGHQRKLGDIDHRLPTGEASPIDELVAG